MANLAHILGLALNVVLVACGAYFGWFSVQIFVTLAVLNFVAILFHELGHAAAFLHVGGRVQRIVVLFLEWNVAKRRMRRSKLSGDGDIGGYVNGTFRPQGATIRDQMLVSAAGPIANVATGVMAAVAAWQWTAPLAPRLYRMPTNIVPAATAGQPAAPASLPAQAIIEQRMQEWDNYVSALWWWEQGSETLVVFAVLSLGLGLLNLLPYGNSDGQHIAQALKMRRMVHGR